MNVRVARTAGFCWGVRRAIDRAIEVAGESEGRARTFGPLIHNTQALERLEAQGVGQIERLEEVADDMTVIIRAHGVSPEARAALEARAARVCDATCAHVAHAQKIVERRSAEGADCVIVGDRDHAETIGIRGHARGGRACVVETPEEADELPADLAPPVVVAQTTQERERFDRVAARLKGRFPGVEIHNTVCSDASDRQAELREMAQSVDAMIVVGGRHSANTNRLAEISRSLGTPTWLIESADELDRATLEPFREVGVTAGASTPDWIIRKVVALLEAL